MRIGDRLLLLFFATLFSASLSGCTGAMSDVIIPITLKNAPATDEEQEPSFPIEVSDLRRDTTLRRTSFSVSLGEVILSPPENELVEDLVRNALQRIFGEKGHPRDLPTVYCGIRTFDITTPATALYWDVTTQIELILRWQGQERVVAGAARERTWVYPSAKILQRVATQALEEVSVSTEQELRSLLGELP